LKEEPTGRSSKKKSVILAMFALGDVLLSLFQNTERKKKAFGGLFIAGKFME
jgi:hypothetical protein